MIRPHDTKSEIAKAVAIAGLSALVTKLVDWAIEHAKARVEGRSQTPQQPTEETKS